MLTSLPHMDNNFTYSGKAEIEGWLKYSIESNLQIAPVEFKASGDITILEAQFYYTNQIIEARLEAQTEAGRFNSLTFYINKIQSLD
jgi:hypothetical protein